MYCKACGIELDDNAVFCRKCGVRQHALNDEEKTHQVGLKDRDDNPNSAPTTSNAAIDPLTVSATGTAANENTAIASEATPETPSSATPSLTRGTKWLKFICYFQLPFSALVTIGSGIQLMSGAYGVDVTQVYSLFPSMTGLDKTCGVVSIALAGYYIYLAVCLIRHRATAPRKYLIAIFFAPLLTLVYSICICITTGLSFSEIITIDFIKSLISTVILFFVNRTYFNNRKYLFC